jgi:hypothetical protein
MNKVYKLMLALLLPLAAEAQQEVANVPLSKFPVSINKIEDIAAVINDDGNASLYLTANNALTNLTTIQLITLSPEGQVLSKSKHPQELFSDEEFIGALVSPNHFNFYRYDKSGIIQEVVNFQVDKTTGLTTPLPSVRLQVDSKSKFITSFVEGNEIVLLYYLKKPASIQVIRLDTAGKQHLSNVPVTIDYGPDRFLRYGDVVYMNESSAKTVFAGHHQKKVYKQGNKLYFVFDRFLPVQKSMATTEILELDLVNNTSNLTKLPTLPIGVSADFNSYLFKDRIFRLMISNKELTLSIYDLDTQKQLASYSFDKDAELTIKSTPVMKRGTYPFLESNFTIIEKTSKVLRQMDKGKPAIVVEDLGNQALQLTIGSYLKLQSGGGGTLMPTGGGSISTPGGMVSLPTSWNYVGGGFYSHGDGISTYFKSFLNANTFEKIERTDEVSLQDQIDKYEEALLKTNVRIGAKTIYKVSDKAFLAYLDQKDKALKLVMFTSKADHQIN